MGYESVVGQRLEDLDTPVLVVDLAMMERNIAKTAKLCADTGVNWRPHSKGVKTPAIVHKEIAAGAIGTTCAKLGEAEVMVAAGIKSVLIANQIVGQQKVTRLANLCRQAEVIVAVDSVENMLELDAAGRQKGLRIPVVVELDTGMERCGVQPGEPAVALSRQVSQCAGLQYMGLMSWEGHARDGKDWQKRKLICEQAVGQLVRSADMCRAAGLPVKIVSCGGTGTEEFSSRVAGVTEIQAGNIIFNDMYYASLGVEREFALTVLSTVVSRPNPTRIVTDAGRKALSCDIALPKPIGVGGVKRVGLSAEHSQIERASPSDHPKVGDKLRWIVGYGDTTVFLHDELIGVRDGIVEVVWPILGRGRLR
jgi:D-serine deaminase-like pyridoxal phosphate-dependent protein